MVAAKNAPVQYVLGVVRFPPVADLDKFAGALKTALDPKYPFGSNSRVTELSIQIGEKGIDVQPQEVSLWQFLDADRKSGLLVNQGLVGLHTTAYDNHENFLGQLMHIVDAARSVEGNHLRYVEAVALRYVDLIVPGADETLLDYMKAKLPVGLEIDGLAVNEGVNILGMKSDVGNLRLQVFLNPKTVIPTDLLSPMFADSGWTWELPKGDFVTVDIDHATIYSPPAEIEKIDIRHNLFSLRKPISDIFKKIATDHAMKVWGLDQ
ncbi:TIGR04255 family protein [Rhizobium sp. AG207R]|uniref:TIGR04255 family protein n=1 Tax=Rhizobium sp. AG207R TaxID=2802287 RepID=UPI0022AC7D3E|nr:TIGR04255 family protein [Rhizobium sp. AG207R]MCZ3380392.1 TIGR04255 family protein [Rhizobium sp. AG207R]